MRGFTRDKILFLCSLTAILALIGVSMFSMRFEVKADNASADTLVVSAVMCENGKKLSLTIDEKTTKNDLKIDEKYIRLKDSSGGVIPLDLGNAEVSGEGAIIIFSKVKIDLNRLKNSTLSLKKGFKVSENGKTLSCDVVWEVNSIEEDNGNILYKPKINFKYSGAAKITLYVGETIKLNSICDPDPKCVGGRWSSESSKIATVKNDVLTAVSVGTTNLRLTFKDGYEYLINVVVKKGSFHQSESGESPKETAESLSESSGRVSDSRNSESEDMSESYPTEESISESESEFESEFTSESESEYESEFESGSVSESDSVSESESETMSEGDRESESEVETASDRKSEENSDKESENYSDESSDNESSSERESEHDGSGSESGNASESGKTDESDRASESGKTDESGNADERDKTDGSDETDERGKTDESDETDERDRTSESGKIDESDKSSGSGGMSDRTTSNTTSNTTSGAASGSDNSGEIGKDGTEKNGRKIVIPLICIAALLVIGILLISKKGDPHA